MHIQIEDPRSPKFLTTPWSLAVAAGAGLMSFMLCRTLLKQTGTAAVIQSYIVAASALGAFEAAARRQPILDWESESKPS